MIEETNPPCVPVAVATPGLVAQIEGSRVVIAVVGLTAAGEPVVWDPRGRRTRLLRQASNVGGQDVTLHWQAR